MYKIAQGHDRPSNDLVPLDPQPRSQGVRAMRRTYAASGAVIEEGKYAELEFDAIDEETYANILMQFGLTGALTAPVTVTLPEIYYAWNRFSGTAIRPALGDDVSRQNFFVRRVRLLIRDLRYASGD